ncbi:MAG: RNA-binding protein [candidate division WOR-3 bacterium]|nr:RNA-binding protein [candidate division WOR-3 bacterium]
MGTRIFVGNLPFSATESQLNELFSQHGEVTSVSIVKDKFTDRSRGFAFVEMTAADAATAAIAALNQHQLEGRPLTVNVARERTEGSRPPRAGGGDRRPPRSGGFSGNRW